MGTFARSILSEIFNDQYKDEKLYVKRTVQQIVFGGYYVPFIKELSNLMGQSLLPNNTFGLYYGVGCKLVLSYQFLNAITKSKLDELFVCVHVMCIMSQTGE